MENKSFVFDLQLFATYTLNIVDWTANGDKKGFQLKSDRASFNSSGTLSGALQAAGLKPEDRIEFDMTTNAYLSGTVDFGGATVVLKGSTAQNFFVASEGTVTVSNVVIESEGTAATNQNIFLVKGDSTTFTLSKANVTQSTKNQGSVIGTEEAATVNVQSSTLVAGSGETKGCVVYADTGKATINFDGDTVIHSSIGNGTDYGNSFYASGATISSSAQITIDGTSTIPAVGFIPGTDSKFNIEGGSFTNVSSKSSTIVNGAMSDSFVVSSGTFDLTVGSKFKTSDGSVFTAKTSNAATSGATLTITVNGSAMTTDGLTGSYDMVAGPKDVTFKSGATVKAGEKSILAGEGWYDAKTYSTGFDKDGTFSNQGWYFTTLPAKVDSSTSGIVFDGASGKVSGTVASDATITFSSAVKSGDVKLTLQGDAKVSKIVNGTDTLVAGSFEIGEDHTLIFGADLSSEESSDDSTDTSDESTDTSDESTDTSDESGDTSDESGDTSDESGDTSDESGETSDESGDTSDESGDTSDESGDTSDESGDTSDESGDTSDESGDTSDESGDTSDESGDTSDESGDTSDESGETSDESGETSDESGETSDDSSSDTSDDTSGDTTDDTDEAESFIKDLVDGEVHDMTDQSSVTLGKGDLASVPSDATGTKTINMGDDAAYVSIAKGAKAKVNINLGAGDNFVSNGGTNTAIDFSNALKTKVALGEGSHADFNSYDWKSGAGIATSADASGLTSFYEALASKLVNLLSAFTLRSTASSDVLDDLGTDTNDADAKSAYVNLYYGSSYNDSVVMGMTGAGDSYINTNENDTLRDEPVVLVGNYTNNVSGTASLISGSGNDGVFAGDGDTVDAGTGTNKIYLNTTGTSAKGTTIMMTSGDNFVTGMDNNDGIITEAGVDAVTAENGNMVFRNDDGGITTIVNGADGVSAYNVRAAGVDYSAVAGTSRVAYNGVSNYYNASNQNASITASTSSAEIWLNKDVARSYGYTSEFIGDIKYVNASGVSGRTTLAGAADIDNVITAGSGAASLWGGGSSDDTLVAGKGSNTFFYMKGDGNDSIRGADDYDTVRIEGGMTLADITKIDVSNAAVALEFSDGGSLTLNSNNGTKFKIDGATYTYDKSAGDWQKS